MLVFWLIGYPHLFLIAKFHFLSLSSKKHFIVPRVSAVCVLFRTYLLIWINYLLGLSNVSLLDIFELIKDIGATVLTTRSILCLQCHVLWVRSHSSLHRVQLLHQSLSLFYHLLCLQLLLFLISFRQCHRKTLQNHMHQSLLGISDMFTLIGKKFLPLNQFRPTPL